MGGALADSLKKEGYELERSIEAALPVPVWSVDFEIERLRAVSAAELAVLRLIEAGVSGVHRLTELVGMGKDNRLVENVLVKLLGAGAIERAGDSFALTSVGLGWKTDGNALLRERVTAEVRLDPALDVLEWVDHEPPTFATEQTWTIELPSVDEDVLRARKPELGGLVREEGLPDEEHKAEQERRPAMDLIAFTVLSNRLHWRTVRVDVWRHPQTGNAQIIGHIGDAENPPLTKLLARHELNPARRRMVRRAP
jgi:hypothetical protein